MDYQILKKTPCKVGQHTWQWTSATVSDKYEPSKNLRCVCGAWKWEDRGKMSECEQVVDGE